LPARSAACSYNSATTASSFNSSRFNIAVRIGFAVFSSPYSRTASTSLLSDPRCGCGRLRMVAGGRRLAQRHLPPLGSLSAATSLRPGPAFVLPRVGAALSVAAPKRGTRGAWGSSGGLHRAGSSGRCGERFAQRPHLLGVRVKRLRNSSAAMTYYVPRFDGCDGDVDTAAVDTAVGRCKPWTRGGPLWSVAVSSTRRASGLSTFAE
jgi:hypothetical protein